MSVEKFITIKRAFQDRLPNEIFEFSERSIGGAIDSSTGDVLKGLSFAEEQILLPDLVNVPANSVHFIQECRKFWQNIEIKVPADGVKLNITTYRVKANLGHSPEAAIAKQQERFDTFDVESETGTAQLEKVVKPEVDDTNFDMPMNVHDYVKYRYILKHNQVAKDKKDSVAYNLPFYIEDKELEDNKEVEKMTLVMKARKSLDKFLTKIEDLTDTKSNDFRSLYAICTLTSEFHTQKIENESKSILKAVWALCEEIPAKVIELADDKSLKDRFLVSSLINYQVVESIDNKIYDKVMGSDPVASSIDEYIKFINLPTNKDVLARLKATLNKKMRN